MTVVSERNRPSSVPRPGGVALDPAALFSGTIRRVHSSLFYKFTMLWVALAMVALFLLYLGLAGALGYGAYQYAIHYYPWDVIKSPNPNIYGKFFMMVLYLSPILGGIMVIVFMLKPLLAPPGRGIPGRVLNREEEPLLFAFVEELCRIIGAPVPRRIEVDCQVDASVAPLRGLSSLLLRRLRLCIGLPLVAGMNLRQFAGILAHELGHFRQGGGLILSYLILRVDLWFTRAVHERDGWDETLEELCKTRHYKVQPIFYAARGCIWLSRRLLWVVMMLSHGICAFHLRAMEYDADRYEARIAGSWKFAETCGRLEILNAARIKTLSNLEHALHDKRLGDNLPELIAANAAALPEEGRAEYLDEVLNASIGLFGSHPSPARRIEHAEREEAPGIITDERPAAELFLHFEEICRVASMDYYTSTLGAAVTQTRLVPMAELLRQHQEFETSLESVMAFFGGGLDAVRPLRLAPRDLVPAENPKALALELKEAREAFLRELPRAREAYARFDKIDPWLQDIFYIQHLGPVKLTSRPDGLKFKNMETFEANRREVEEYLGELDAGARPFEAALAARLTAAIRLLYTPQLQQRLPESPRLLERAAELVAAMDHYHAELESIVKLRRLKECLERLMEILKKNAKEEGTQELLRTVSRPLVRQMSGIQGSMNLVRYPFEHGQGQVSVGQYLMDAPPDPKDFAATWYESTEMIRKLNKFFYRVAGELGQIAGQVETALGLLPLGEADS